MSRTKETEKSKKGFKNDLYTTDDSTIFIQSIC